MGPDGWLSQAMNSASPILRLRGHRQRTGIPLTDDRANPALLLAVITDRAPDGIDASCNRGLRNHAPIPNGCEEIVFADHAVAIAIRKTRMSNTCGSTVINFLPDRSSRARHRESCRQKGTPREHPSASKSG